MPRSPPSCFETFSPIFLHVSKYCCTFEGEYRKVESLPEETASFLRCSKHTVYSYRSRIRLRSLCPDDFENQVLRIE